MQIQSNEERDNLMSTISLDTMGIQFDTDKSSRGHNYLDFYEEFFLNIKIGNLLLLK